MLLPLLFVSVSVTVRYRVLYKIAVNQAFSIHLATKALCQIEISTNTFLFSSVLRVFHVAAERRPLR
jgi:hypothetical protein